MSSSEFARSQLYKHGWQSGKGLGRSENGIQNALKVKLKNNTNGLGLDQGSEFTFHWWDHIFNKAANSIKVFSTEDGDKVEKDLNAKKVLPSFISAKKPLKHCYEGKPLLYGSFVKAGTLKEELDQTDVMLSVGNSDSESSESDDDLNATDTLEKTFKLTGLTGHKAARHGFKLGGKLKRIQEQEAKAVSMINLYPSNLEECSLDLEISNCSDGRQKKSIKKRKLEIENLHVQEKFKNKKKKNSKEIDDVLENSEIIILTEKKLKKKKLKKK
ncbi:G patch domain-containing protein 4 [Hydra vulgaris]|uniref:G patch domain-containing protein 4 n=1 Tax=Hydra vulgaris TaxID=6087 RepID=A0ABM4CPY0_HYDVU